VLIRTEGRGNSNTVGETVWKVSLTIFGKEGISVHFGPTFLLFDLYL
jgi:hypothetical protein